MDEGGTEVALEREVALVLLKIDKFYITVDIDGLEVTWSFSQILGLLILNLIPTLHFTNTLIKFYTLNRFCLFWRQILQLPLKASFIICCTLF